MLLQLFGVHQFPCQNGFLLIFIGIEGGNALLRGTVFLVLQAKLLQLVKLPVPGQKQRSPVADHQVFGGQGNALSGDSFHFLPEIFRVQCHAVAQNVHHTRAENAAGQQMQGKFAVLIDDRMAGVAAALIAHHDIVVLRQQIHHTSLALIAPVDSHDCTI